MRQTHSPPLGVWTRCAALTFFVASATIPHVSGQGSFSSVLNGILYSDASCTVDPHPFVGKAYSTPYSDDPDWEGTQITVDCVSAGHVGVQAYCYTPDRADTPTGAYSIVTYDPKYGDCWWLGGTGQSYDFNAGPDYCTCYSLGPGAGYVQFTSSSCDDGNSGRCRSSPSGPMNGRTGDKRIFIPLVMILLICWFGAIGRLYQQCRRQRIVVSFGSRLVQRPSVDDGSAGAAGGLPYPHWCLHPNAPKRVLRAQFFLFALILCAFAIDRWSQYYSDSGLFGLTNYRYGSYHVTYSSDSSYSMLGVGGAFTLVWCLLAFIGNIVLFYQSYLLAVSKRVYHEHHYHLAQFQFIHLWLTLLGWLTVGVDRYPVGPSVSWLLILVGMMVSWIIMRYFRAAIEYRPSPTAVAPQSGAVVNEVQVAPIPIREVAYVPSIPQRPLQPRFSPPVPPPQPQFISPSTNPYLSGPHVQLQPLPSQPPPPPYVESTGVEGAPGGPSIPSAPVHVHVSIPVEGEYFPHAPAQLQPAPFAVGMEKKFCWSCGSSQSPPPLMTGVVRQFCSNCGTNLYL